MWIRSLQMWWHHSPTAQPTWPSGIHVTVMDHLCAKRQIFSMEMCNDLPSALRTQVRIWWSVWTLNFMDFEFCICIPHWHWCIVVFCCCICSGDDATTVRTIEKSTKATSVSDATRPQGKDWLFVSLVTLTHSLCFRSQNVTLYSLLGMHNTGFFCQYLICRYFSTHLADNW